MNKITFDSLFDLIDGLALSDNKKLQLVNGMLNIIKSKHI